MTTITLKSGTKIEFDHEYHRSRVYRPSIGSNYVYHDMEITAQVKGFELLIQPGHGPHLGDLSCPTTDLSYYTEYNYESFLAALKESNMIVAYRDLDCLAESFIFPDGTTLGKEEAIKLFDKILDEAAEYVKNLGLSDDEDDYYLVDEDRQEFALKEEGADYVKDKYDLLWRKVEHFEMDGVTPIRKPFT